MKNSVENHTIVEQTVRGFLKAGVRLEEILVGVHNACVHGTAIEEAGGEITDEQLSKLFDGFDTAIAASKGV